MADLEAELEAELDALTSSITDGAGGAPDYDEVSSPQHDANFGLWKVYIRSIL
jgi:hypothetical protein